MIQVPVHRGGKIVANALLDDEDAHLAAYRWRLRKDGYVQRSEYVRGVGKRTQQLHRAVLGLKHADGLIADHINGDTLDNRRSNLRAVTNRENQQNRRGPAIRNRSGLRGVSFNRHSGRWRAYIGKEYLGQFATAEEAAAVAAEARVQRGYLSGAEGARAGAA